MLRGAAEAHDEDVDAWEQQVKRWVLYHPAGRQPERKISNPTAALLPGAALPGELALVEALATLDDRAHRWARLYDDDDLATDAILSDPAELGADYDPAEQVPGATWDALAAWGGGSTAFPEALRQRVRTRWVLIGGRETHLGGPTLLPALEASLDDVVRFPYKTDDLARQLRGQLTDAQVRLVIVAEEAGIADVLRILPKAGDIRDQIAAVVSIGGVIGGRSDDDGPLGEVACRDWLEACFAQRVLDTDVVRLTPYFSLQWLDRQHWPPGVPGLPLHASRFPTPSEEGATAVTLEVVDLGPLPADPEVPTDAVAKALIAVVSAWVLRRR